MTPYYSEAGITIYHGDAREVLPTLGTVDLVLTDPPYGIGVCNRSDGGVGSIVSGSKFYGRMAWDRKKIDGSLLAAVLAAGRELIIWGGNFYDLPPSSCWLIWDKMQRNFTFADAEMAWTNLDKAIRIYSYSRGELTVEGKDHPTQKPLPLMKWCLGHSRTSGTVLDPFMGSGTTLRAAKDLGRKAIGIEICEEYAEIAAKRLSQGVLDFAEARP